MYTNRWLRSIPTQDDQRCRYFPGKPSQQTTLFNRPRRCPDPHMWLRALQMSKIRRNSFVGALIPWSSPRALCFSAVFFHGAFGKCFTAKRAALKNPFVCLKEQLMIISIVLDSAFEMIESIQIPNHPVVFPHPSQVNLFLSQTPPFLVGFCIAIFSGFWIGKESQKVSLQWPSQLRHRSKSPHSFATFDKMWLPPWTALASRFTACTETEISWALCYNLFCVWSVGCKNHNPKMIKGWIGSDGGIVWK